jgi:eukaryotic-like serine/threonine-protein kinase
MEQTVLLVQKFGKYETWEKIGEGNYGSTYRSRDPLLDRPVVIKALRPELTTSPDFMEHFRREARQLASLRHPNVVNVMDGGDQDGQFYLVLEYLPGGSLQTMLQDTRPWSLSRAIELLRPLAEALDHAHSRRVIHRNLKPSNILLAEDGRPVLTDFTMVKPTLRGSNGSTVAIVGTPEYLAPEQIQGLELGPEVDQYSLGVIAYQMVTGHLPFSGSPQQVYRGHIEVPPPDIRQWNPALPKEIHDTLVRALAKEPSRRFPSTREFIDTLDRIALRMSRELGRSLYQAAKEHMKLLQFEAAIAKLEQMQAVRQTPDAETLLKECQRRKKMLDEVQTLRGQIAQAQARIELLLTSETWLKGQAPQNGKGSLLQKMTGKH